MRVVNLDKRLIPSPQCDNLLRVALLEENIAVACFRNKLNLWQYAVIDICSGHHEPIELPHKDIIQDYSDAGLIYLALEKQGESGDLLGVYQLSASTRTVCKITEIRRERGPDYWGMDGACFMSINSPVADHVWISISPQLGQPDEHENLLFASSQARLHVMDSIKDHVYAFELVNNEYGAFYALYIGSPDANDKEYYWREFGPDGLPSEKVVVVPCESILRPDQFMVVENAHKEAGLNWLFKSVNGKIFYEYCPFGKPPELRAYTPGTGTLDIRQLDVGLADVILVDEQPYFFQWGKSHRLVEFYGDAEIRYPKTWGDPVRVIRDTLFTEVRLLAQDRLSRKYRAYDLKRKKLIWEGAFLLFSQNTPILFV